MAIQNFPKITKIDPKAIVTPLKLQPQKVVAPLPTLWEFVQKKTGVKTELTPAPKILQTWAQTLKQESKRIQDTAKAVVQKKQQEAKKAEAPKFEMTRQDVIDAMVEKHPALSQALQAWEVTQDDIFAASLEKYKAIKDMNNTGKIDSTQRVQEEFQSKYTPEPKSLLEKASQWSTDIIWWLYKAGTATAQLWEKWADFIAKKILWETAYNRAKSKIWPTMWETTGELFKKTWVNENSTAFKVWKWIWDFAQTSAITTAIPGVWLLRWLGIVWKTAVWATEGAIGTQASSLIDKWEFASAKDTAIWAGIWGILRGVSGIWQKGWSISQTEKLIMPKMTPSVTAERAKEGLMKTNMFWNVSSIASKREKEMAQTALNILRPKETVVSNINRSLKALNSETDSLINVVKNSPVTYQTKDIIGRMRSIEKPLMIRWWENEAKYDAVIKKFESILNKSDKTAAWLLRARKEFDSFVNAEIPNLYTSDTMSPLKVAITKLRKIPNEWLNEKVWGDIVKGSLSKQNQLLDIIDNLSTKAESEGSTALQRWIRKNPLKAKAIWWWSLVWAWYALRWSWVNVPTSSSE